MRLLHFTIRYLVATLILVSLAASNAHAYLDPGTGSYVLQLVIAALLGAAFAVKIFWLRVKTFFVNLVARKPKEK